MLAPVFELRSAVVACLGPLCWAALSGLGFLCGMLLTYRSKLALAPLLSEPPLKPSAPVPPPGRGLLHNGLRLAPLQLQQPAGHPAASARCRAASAGPWSASRTLPRQKEALVEHCEQYFVNRQGLRVYTQQWLPCHRPMRATILVLHGLNEHSGRYEAFAQVLNQQGYGVFALDWIGHGRSEGLHGYVERLDHIVEDVLAYLKEIRRLVPHLPCFAFAHSTGGSIVLKALHLAPEAGVSGLVLTAPAFQIVEPNPVLLALADKYSDPLVYTGKVRARMGTEILKLAREVRVAFKDVKTPFLVCHGSDDLVTLSEGSRELYEMAPVAEKKLRVYEGLFHDLIFEPEKDQVVDDILLWLEERLAVLQTTHKQDKQSQS